MSELPFVPFKEPTHVNYELDGVPVRKTIKPPSRSSQRQRFEPRFAALERGLATPEGLAELRRDPGSIAPERAIVFELSADADPAKFYSALRNIPEFEALGDDEAESEPSHGFVKIDGRGRPTERRFRKRLYFAMPSREALQNLLSLWRRYEKNLPFNRTETPKLTAWRDVFDNLYEVRPWGASDRLPDEMVKAWQEDLKEAPEEEHTIEIELWYRDKESKRKAASKELRRRVARLGGEVLDECVHEGICYHALLVTLPAKALRDLCDRPSDGLAVMDDVMFLRTQTLAAIRLSVADEGETGEISASDAPSEDTPVVAMFDGLPLSGHIALSGRLRVEDPWSLADEYGSATDQQHGTAMASLILHGDGHAPTPVSHQIYVQPVTVPDGHHERLPKHRLAVAVLDEAFCRMLTGITLEDGTQIAASAPNVRIVNLCLGDERRRFAGIVSPWARLLDHWAYRHRLLFLVSAGNITEEFEVLGVASFSDLEGLPPEERSEALLRTVFAAKAHRALLAPAEAINVMTVGAQHADAVGSNDNGAMCVDPYHQSNMPNVSSALGTGANRCPKPEILMPGGRETVQMRVSRNPLKVVPNDNPGRFFGLRAATPGIRGELDRMRNVSGTSAATALATNAALRIEESLRTVSQLAVPKDMLAVVTKALLAHSAVWDEEATALIHGLAREEGYEHWMHQRIEISRFLGLGHTDTLRVMGNTKQRALALGFGTLPLGKAAPYPLPLPMSLSGKPEWRGLTATLAWLTPIHCRHTAYRHGSLDLWLSGMEKGAALGVGKLSEQPDDKSGGRGTIIHRRWSGEDPAVFFPQQGVELLIGCRSPTKGLVSDIPYAVAVTLEVGVGSQIDVLTEIEQNVRAGVPIKLRSNGTEPG